MSASANGLAGEQPVYILFAGVNGAGKSTFFKTNMWRTRASTGTLPRVNSDEILAAHGWDWQDEAAQLRAGREAVRLIRQHFENRESFNQETTLTGRSIMRNLALAKEFGYRIIIFYVGVSDPETANARIAHRATIGGHSIDSETVAKRYDASLRNLEKAIAICDETHLYDNSRLFQLQASFARDELVYCAPRAPLPTWVEQTLKSIGYIEISF